MAASWWTHFVFQVALRNSVCVYSDVLTYSNTVPSHTNESFSLKPTGVYNENTDPEMGLEERLQTHHKLELSLKPSTNRLLGRQKHLLHPGFTVL